MILDTNAISALARKDQALIARLESARDLSVTVISLGELAYGLRHSTARRELETWVRTHLLTRVAVLFLDLSSVEHYGDIRSELRIAGKPIPANDIWIAALARQHDLPVLSRDTHFDLVPRIERVAW